MGRTVGAGVLLRPRRQPGVWPLHRGSLCDRYCGQEPLHSAFLQNKRPTDYFPPAGRDLSLLLGLIGPYYHRIRKPRLFCMGDGGGVRRPEGMKSSRSRRKTPGIVLARLGPGPSQLFAFPDDTV